jgi:hypothetical protein
MKYFDSFQKQFINDPSFISLLCYIHNTPTLFHFKHQKYNLRTLLKHLYQYNIDYFQLFLSKLHIFIDDYNKIEDIIIPFIYFEISITVSSKKEKEENDEEESSQIFYSIDYGLCFLVGKDYYEFGRYYFHYIDSGYHSYNECFYYLTCLNAQCYYLLDQCNCLLKKKFIKYKKLMKKKS